jgi:hypothetical protein
MTNQTIPRATACTDSREHSPQPTTGQHRYPLWAFLLIALALLATSFTTQAQISYLDVGTTQTDLDATQNQSGTGWDWVAATNTFTLSGDIIGSIRFYGGTGDVNFVVSGSHTVVPTIVHQVGKLTISGGGTLNTNQLQIHSGDLEISGATVNITSSEAWAHGVFINGYDFKMSSGTLNITATGAGSTGISTNGGGDLIISGSASVTAASTENMGIYVHNLTVSGGTLSGTSGNNSGISAVGAVSIGGGSVTANSSSTVYEALRSYGDIDITGGTLTATGGSNGRSLATGGSLKVGGASANVSVSGNIGKVSNSGGSLTVSGGTASVTGNIAGDVTVSAGTVTIGGTVGGTTSHTGGTINGNPPPSGTAPTITTTTLANGTVGTVYSQTLAATGTAPFTWSLSAGSLPAGLSLNGTTGAISGTPTTAGTATFIVKATNGTAPDATKQLSITIAVAPVTDAQAPNITAHPRSASYIQGDEAAALSVAASVSDGGILSYQWYRNTTNRNSGGITVGTNRASYTPPTATASTSYYYVVVTNSNNTATGAKTATATSYTAAVAVTALVDAKTPLIALHPQGATYVQGEAAVPLSVTAYAPDGGTLSYQWYKSVATPIDGATGSSYTPSTETAGTAYYLVLITNTNNGVNGTKTASITSNTATITVTAAPTYAVSIGAMEHGGISASPNENVMAGATVLLTVTPAAGYKLNTISAHKTGNAATRVETRLIASLPDNRATYELTMPAHDVTIEAEFTVATGSYNPEATALRAYVRDGLMHVGGLSAGKPWSVYSVAGVAVYQGIADGNLAYISLPVRGVYIVKSGSKTIKVVY